MTPEEKQIEALLQQKIGLKKDSINARQITNALENRRLACDLPDLKSYVQFLETSSQEWWELIDQIVVPETWFFRHREAFKFLHKYVKTEWLKPKCRTRSAPQPVSILRVLSLPCSTGEEPYSIAITLLEAGLTSNQFQIDALDISHRALEKAKKAVYGENSFREDLTLPKNHYFHQIQESYQLSELVRETVQFKEGNLLGPHLPVHKPYQIIFCRHLLIYLDVSARSRAIDRLDQLLVPRGFLFVGSPEIALLPSPRFQVIDYPYAFVYQKNEKRAKHKNPKPEKSIIQKKIRPSNPTELTSLAQAQTHLKKGQTISPLSLANHPQSPPKNPLAQARDLADSGALEQAASLCRAYLNQTPSDPQAYLLLGQIYQALGSEIEAEQYFQKVVYLDPNCEEALIHLALLKESRGDLSGATLIRQRIQRLFKLRDNPL